MDFEGLREEMIQTQIARRGVTDARVLGAMREVPRHLFVPAHLMREAYSDRPLGIGEGQTISQPFMVALMTQALSVEPGDRVLEIGTGSGYQAAILARLASDVLTIERHAPLAERARERLAEVGATNVTVRVADGTEGAPDRAPFDRILVTAGAPAVPAALQSQLAVGGRLVIPVGPSGFQHLTTVVRTEAGFDTHLGEACVFVPLIGRQGWPDRG
ncbi:MAG TPA: protein-L-isoaspartate(D-aspartate) O-methyltransferase [Vicinamibacterales bacterium]